MRREIVRLGLVLAIVAGGASGFAYLQGHRGAHLTIDAPAPGFRLQDRAGHAVDLHALRGRVVLVNFWASWCPPCLEEMPSLERLHRTLAPEGLVVLGVSVDEQERAIAPVLARYSVTFTVLRDPDGSVSGAYGITGFPETYLVDASGTLREKYVGPVNWDEPGAIDHLRTLLRAAR